MKYSIVTVQMPTCVVDRVVEASPAQPRGQGRQWSSVSVIIVAGPPAPGVAATEEDPGDLLRHVLDVEATLGVTVALRHAL